MTTPPTDAFGLPRETHRAPDMSAMFTPPLILTGPNGIEYKVAAPSYDDGLIMTAFNASITNSISPDTDRPDTGACPTCGQERLTSDHPRVQAILEQAKGRPLEELALGHAVLEKMRADGIAGADIATLATYAMMYWTFGESQANAWVESRTGQGGDTPKA